MEIKSANFVKGIRGTDEIMESSFLQLAFYGRSNVGKSSSINALLNRKKLVKSSSKPGKTRELNFFNINDKFYIVDLPGYGYAKVGPREKEKLRKLIRWYLIDSKPRERVNVLLLDSRIGLTDYDLEILNIFEEKREKVIIIFNKIDKLKQSLLSKNLKKIRSEVTDQVEVVPFSSVKKKGVEKFWQIFESIVNI